MLRAENAESVVSRGSRVLVRFLFIRLTNWLDLRRNRAHNDVDKIPTRLRVIGPERAEIGRISREGFTNHVDRTDRHEQS